MHCLWRPEEVVGVPGTVVTETTMWMWELRTSGRAVILLTVMPSLQPLTYLQGLAYLRLALNLIDD